MLNLKPLRFQEREDIVLWSDLHLRHERSFILEPRGYPSHLGIPCSKAHDANIIKSLQEFCGPETTLFLLGDTIFGIDAEQYWWEFLASFTAKRVFIMPGNHFAGLEPIMRSKGCHFKSPCGKDIRLIPNIFEIEVGNQMAILGHYPVASWNKIGKGAIMIHGHCHSNLIRTELGYTLYKGRICDIGVECRPKPVTFQELVDEFAKKPIVTTDHH